MFLEVPEGAWVAANELAFAFHDRYPVSPGHTLVVTRRVVPDWFAATSEERSALLSLVDEVKRLLDRELVPDGYNVGFNAGVAAGQTVMHLHVHVIPRFRGDMEDPRGGVRHVIPSKGNYLRQRVPPATGGEVAFAAPDAMSSRSRERAPLATGGEADPFARHVLPLFERADEIAIVAAFVQESGLARIRTAMHAALARGARIRILTGDYLDITQASALEMLLGWQRAPGAEEGDNGDEGDDSEGDAVGGLEAAVIEVAQLPPRGRSFHPKSWRFESGAFGVAFVGSSNLSRTALEAGIEWNLRVDRDRDAVAYGRIREAFDELWARARRLDAEWVADYARRTRARPVALPPGEVEQERLEAPPEPHEAQRAALMALREGRQRGHRRAVVVLATGLGKTWLAAFDFAQLREELGRRPRLLFLAHRRELLVQAALTYRRQLQEMKEAARVGWFVGAEGDLSAELVFASVAKLSRPEHVRALAAQEFDYVVIDEVHHAAAESYRRIIDQLEPRFLLGLTATPDRADSANILGLFDDFVAYRADIPQGIASGRLIPFLYYGVKDDIDYTNIPWRNRRFDPEALAAAAQTEARMRTLWRVWNAHPGRRSLVFCCSRAHADHVRASLRGLGVRVAAVYTGEGSDGREESLERLAAGELDAVCAVDVFNEGVDVPSIDRIVMLRPTESGTVFLQQLGRGLRAAEGKPAVTVIDFVGNHRVFLARMRTLLSLGGASEPGALRRFLDETGPLELPEGCSVVVELEAKELLSRLFRVSGADEVERAYREICIERGADADRSLRPTAGELQRMGYLPSRLRERYGSWFELVRREGGLTDDEEQVLERAGGFLREVEVTEMTKCFKMVTLEVLLEQDALRWGMPLRELAERAHAVLRRSPELFEDVPEELRKETLDGGERQEWVAYWRRNPIAAWTAEKRDRRTWFRIEGDRFVLALGLASESGPGQARQQEIDERDVAPLAKLTRELVDYRLTQYRARRRERVPSAEDFVCRVISNRRDPILKLPDRAKVRLPEGETAVRLADGAAWQFRFVKEFCNVARRVGGTRNELPDLLRGWFGPRVGQPGTAFQVRFHAGPEGLWVEPVEREVIELASRRRIAAYPDLRAAAGHAQGASEPPDNELVWLPVDGLLVDEASRDLFAVRVSGSSMDGGKEPLRDGDWAVMRVARSMPASAVENRVVLVETGHAGFGAHYQIKRLRRRGKGWLLASDNPEGPTIEATEEMVPIARLERAFRPESLGPEVGTVLEEPEIAARFSLEAVAPRSDRYSGHLFIFVDRKGMLEATDRLRFDAIAPRAAETAFVLIAREGRWRYVGIARQTGERGVWSLPEVDPASWRTWGESTA